MTCGLGGVGAVVVGERLDVPLGRPKGFHPFVELLARGFFAHDAASASYPFFSRGGVYHTCAR